MALLAQGATTVKTRMQYKVHTVGFTHAASELSLMHRNNTKSTALLLPLKSIQSFWLVHGVVHVHNFPPEVDRKTFCLYKVKLF